MGTSDVGPGATRVGVSEFQSLERRALMSSGFEAFVDFRPTRTPTVDGYVTDIGAPYRRRQGFRYGWSADRRHAVFERDEKHVPDDRYGTLASLPRKGGFWEIQVPDGTYEVRIVAGDPEVFNKTVMVQAEGVPVVEGKTSRKRAFIDRRQIVKVTDGRLTISGDSHVKGNSIAFIEVREARDPSATYEAEEADVSKGVKSNDTAAYNMDRGDYLAFENLSFDGTFRSLQLRMGAGAEEDGQLLEVRLDSPDGEIIGTLEVEGAGSGKELRVQSVDVSSVLGVHDVYLVSAGNAEVGKIDWVRFSENRVVRVMALGDSITESLGDRPSYRWGLWKMMEEAGYSADFVGPVKGLHPRFGEPLHHDYDLDGAGYSGYTTGDILFGEYRIREGFERMFEQNTADVVLVHLGTNDLFQAVPTEKTIANLEALVAAMRRVNPSVTVLLARIFPAQRSTVTLERVEAMNAAIAGLAQRISTDASRVNLVDQYTGFDFRTDTVDLVHPNADAEGRMARRWFEALQQVI